MSTIAPAAPAATPPPAPSTPTPAPAAAPAAQPSAAPKSEFDAAWDKLDSRATPKAPEPKQPEPKAKEPKPAEPKAPDPAAPKNPAAEPAKEGPKALRDALEKRNKEFGELESKVKEFEKRIADADAKGKDSTALTERLATLEKQIAEKESEIRGLRQKSSPEFKSKYEKPFNDAAESAKSIIEGLTVTEVDAAGNETQRPAKWEDFVGLYQMKHKAIPLISKLFKESSPVVTQQLLDLLRLDSQRQTALKEEQENWKANEDKRVAEATKHKEFIAETWTKVNRDVAEKSEWFQPDPQDPEATKLLEDGYKLVDSQPTSPQEQIVRDAQIRNRAAAHARMKYEIGKLKATLAERDATIAEMKGSEPGAVHRPGGDGQPAVEKDWKSDLRESGAINSQ